jgi:AcrR family transcriptional regulator
MRSLAGIVNGTAALQDDRTMARRMLGAEDWEEAALHALAEGGLAALSVEMLARKLGVTKGSFYWHFRDREALLAAALTRWEARATTAIIDELRPIDDPAERLAQLFFRVSRAHEKTRALYVAIAAAASQHRGVAATLDRVTARRLAFMVEAYRALGGSSREAKERALLAYAAYIGFLHIGREAPKQLPSGKAFDSYLGLVVQALVPKRKRAARRA